MKYMFEFKLDCVRKYKEGKRVIEENLLNPSCWTGPIWMNVNYFFFEAVLRYGYLKEAKALASATIHMLGDDIKQSGAMHEYYNPETGKGVYNLGFQSWNLLVNLMIDEEEKIR